MVSGIYAIRNVLADKLYIGQCREKNHGIEGRWRAHRRSLSAGKHPNKKLQNAWNKYGPEAFVLEIIEELDPDPTILNEREVFYIRILDTIRSGYNITAGGASGKYISEATRLRMSGSLLGRQLSLEHRQRIAVARTGMRFTEEHKAKLSIANSGKPCPDNLLVLNQRQIGSANPFFGRHHSDESRFRMSENRRGKNLGPLSAEHRSSISETMLRQERRKPRETRACPLCSTEFKVTAKSNKRFCSRNCVRTYATSVRTNKTHER